MVVMSSTLSLIRRRPRRRLRHPKVVIVVDVIIHDIVRMELQHDDDVHKKVVVVVINVVIDIVVNWTATAGLSSQRLRPQVIVVVDVVMMLSFR